MKDNEIFKGNGWVRSVTFGKSKPFWWRVDENCNIHIRREFVVNNAPQEKCNTIQNDELDLLVSYMSQQDWVPLANNVEKLGNGSEKSGIGKFLYDTLGKDSTEAQSASQLVVILTLSGVLEYNNKKRNMEFKLVSKEWIELVRNYYCKYRC